MKKEKFAIIDANALIHRGFHALPPLTTKDGVLVNAVYGFATILLKVLKDIKPDYTAVCFDVSRETFRKEIDVNYKAHRESGPQELYDQIDMVKEMVKAFNMPIYAIRGYEADDLIGTLVEKTKKKNIENYIVTGDMDTLQLVDENTKVYTLKKGINDTIIYDEASVKEKYGFGPELVVDYKALRGDPSDNISGVKGIGEKTATDLIKEFGEIEDLYKFVAENKEQDKIKERVAKLLKEHKKEALMSKKLATIKCDVKMNFKLDEARVQPFNAARIVELFQEWNFKSLIARISAAEKVITKGQKSFFDSSSREEEKKEVGFEIREGYKLVDSEESYEDFIEKLREQKIFAIDTETTGIDPFQCELIGMSFSWEEGKGYYLVVENLGELKDLKAILKDNKIKKVGHNIKFDMEVLNRAGFEFQGVEFDTMVGSYLLNPGSRQHGLDALVFTEFGYEMTPITSLIGPNGKNQLTMDQVEVSKVADYAIEDTDYTWRLYELLKKRLEKNNLSKLMEDIENPLIGVLARIEENGVAIDEKFLNKLSKKLGDKVDELEKKMFKLAGGEFNPRSPIQLKEVLFDKLQISTAGLARTKTGISTAASELEKISGAHPIINLIYDHREFSKLKSTYTDALPLLVNKETGRIHTSYNQTVTATGRLSSSDPNLQNIPIRTELGREVRKAFVAASGYKLAAIDYSQIELRIAAHMSGDPKIIEAFREGEDIHTRTASEVFNVKPKDVTSEMRRKAKEVNFGVIYGLGPRGLAQRTGVSYDEATAFIEKYFEIFSGLRDYLEETIEEAHEVEYVETLFGRKRFLPEINANHSGLRSQAERMAINHPLQGTAADLIKMAMIRVDELIAKKYKNSEVRMIMQVHDELIFEIRERETKRITDEIKKEMEMVYKFKVPIVAEAGVGDNWGECK